MDRLKINKNLLPIKSHYFLAVGGISCAVPFISVYAQQLKITADAMGRIYAFIFCFTAISKPLFGGIVDHFQNLKLVLTTLICITIAAGMGLNFIPPLKLGNETYKITLIFLNDEIYRLQLKQGFPSSNNLTYGADNIISCTCCRDDNKLCMGTGNQTFNFNKSMCINGLESLLNVTSGCIELLTLNCTDTEKTDCNQNCSTISEYSDANTTEVNPPLQLWMVSVFTGIIYICQGSAAPLADAACFNALGSKTHLFGKQRMWGTIGRGTFAILAGYLNQVVTGTSRTYDYSAGFYMFGVLLVIDMLVIRKLQLRKVHVSKNICKDVVLLVVKPKVVFFILQVFFVGVFIGMSRSYLFWYLRMLDANQLVLGSISTVQCFLGELPFFFFSGWIIAKLGHVNTFTMSFVAHGIKFLSYSFLKNPWWCLPIGILQGPCYGSFYSAMASYAKVIAPEGTETTVQGLASGSLEGLGVATGCLLGGYGFQNYGGRVTFFYSGIISMGIGMLNCVINKIVICRN